MKHFRNIPTLVVLPIVLLFFAGCEGTPQDNTAEVRQAVDAANKQYMEAARADDAAAFVALYSAEPKLLVPNKPMIVGREQLLEHFQPGEEAREVDLQLTTIEFNVSGDWAYEVGEYDETVQIEGAEPISDKGKYVMIWKLEEGSWKMAVDIWNTDMPLPEESAHNEGMDDDSEHKQ